MDPYLTDGEILDRLSTLLDEWENGEWDNETDLLSEISTLIAKRAR